MERVWRWIRDKQQSSFRKWRSSQIFQGPLFDGNGTDRSVSTQSLQNGFANKRTKGGTFHGVSGTPRASETGIPAALSRSVTNKKKNRHYQENQEDELGSQQQLLQSHGNHLSANLSFRQIRRRLTPKKKPKQMSDSMRKQEIYPDASEPGVSSTQRLVETSIEQVEKLVLNDELTKTEETIIKTPEAETELPTINVTDDDLLNESRNEIRQMLIEDDNSDFPLDSYMEDLPNQTSNNASLTDMSLIKEDTKVETNNLDDSNKKPPVSILSSGADSTKSQRRHLRFAVEPEISSSVDNLDVSLIVEHEKAENMPGPSSSYSASSSTGLNDQRRHTVNELMADHLSPPKRQSYDINSGGADTAPSSPASSPQVFRRTDKRRASLAMRRQSNAQTVTQASGRRTSTTLIPLTLAQIHLVRSLWRQIFLTKGPTVIGQTVMYRLFFKCPKLKEQFRVCPLPKKYPNPDSFARNHSKAMAELVVENLDDLQSVGQELERIGRIHATILSGQLSTKLWNMVAETFIDCTLEWGDRRCRSETVRKAWALIIAYMVEKIKHGHQEERKQLLIMRSTIASLQRVGLPQSENNMNSSSMNLQTS